MALKLVHWDHPSLRTKCEPKTEFTDEVKQFIKDLLDIMHGKDLYTKTSRPIGLAAPQVESKFRIFSVCPYQLINDKEEFGPAKIYVNPKLSEPSLEFEIQDEGCLSFPGLYLPIERPYEITLEYQDENGKHHKERLSGFYARQIMHENDHLNGVLYIDRISKTSRKRLKSRLDTIKKRFSKK